jgi:hypothetical protein
VIKYKAIFGIFVPKLISLKGDVVKCEVKCVAHFHHNVEKLE